MAEIDVTFLPRDTDVRKGYADAMRGNPPSKRTVPMTGNSMGKGMTNRGMTSGNAMAPPKVTPVGDYMGMAFDASVRKGKDAARAYLLTKMKRDGRSEAVIQSQLKQFDDSIGIQKSLQKDTGLGEGIEKVYRDAAKQKRNVDAADAPRLRDVAENEARRAKTAATIFGDSARQKTKLATERYNNRNSQGLTRFDSGASTPY
jgi:hypothetical protein